MIRASKKTRARRRVQAKADAACRAEVFERDGGKCVRCGSERFTQWAHVITRRDKTLRCDPMNSMVLCAGCHLWWHEHTLESATWFMNTYPLRYEYLMECRRTIKRIK